MFNILLKILDTLNMSQIESICAILYNFEIWLFNFYIIKLKNICTFILSKLLINTLPYLTCIG